jgi:hypothetical protein
MASGMGRDGVGALDGRLEQRRISQAALMAWMAAKSHLG